MTQEGVYFSDGPVVVVDDSPVRQPGRHLYSQALHIPDDPLRARLP